MIGLVSLVPAPADGQGRSESFTAPRTPHGHPDLLFLQQSPDAIYEYACHEGNPSLDGMLAGARHQEGSAGSR